MPNRKKNYRDMQLYKETTQAQNKRYYQKTAKYPKRAWTPEEEELVLEHDLTDNELSSKISRSVKAIQVRRAVLKKKQK